YDRVIIPFFYLYIRRPASSTLFPYTTLFRSHRLGGRQGGPGARCGTGLYVFGRSAGKTGAPAGGISGVIPGGAVRRLRRQVSGRSEEHTSELQSRENLVCRLLLEKKKKTSST